MRSILVVCEGNICRSPMAAAILQRHFPSLSVRSAGLSALSGHPADPIAIRLMREAEGLDIAGHRAIQITREMCLQSDLILVMDSRQRRALEEKFYFSCGRIFRLGEFSKNDIADPFQRGEAAFISAMNLIRSGSAAWHERIQKIFKVPA